jgi:8-oxo-dGTP pyrophosphatase MutT (NUDIX family)
MHPATAQLEQLRRALTSRPARIIAAPGQGHAAVALILRPVVSDLEILFIERAAHPQDPWSGNLAFPGGRLDPSDAGARQAAERETREEIGLDLAGADYLGQLDDILGAYLPVRVSCFVYGLMANAPLAVNCNHEVSDFFFVPLNKLRDPRRHFNAEIEWRQELRQTPAIDLLGPGRPLLWGITYRLVDQLLTRLGRPLSAPA